jgi:hypothetical protein
MDLKKGKINCMVDSQSTAAILILKRELVKGWKN